MNFVQEYILRYKIKKAYNMGRLGAFRVYVNRDDVGVATAYGLGVPGTAFVNAVNDTTERGTKIDPELGPDVDYYRGRTIRVRIYDPVQMFCNSPDTSYVFYGRSAERMYKFIEKLYQRSHLR